MSFGTDYVVSRVFNLPSITSTAAVPNPIVNMSMVAASIVSTEAFSTDNVLSRDMSLPPIVPTANVSIDNILSRDLFTTSIESTLVVGEPADDVYLLANGYIYVSNNNTITTYLGKPITQHLDDPVIIGTPFVVQGDGSAIFSTIVKGGSQIEIQDIVPGTSGNTTYIVNTVFSNTTFTINTEFTGGNMSNGVFRYIYDGNI